MASAASSGSRALRVHEAAEHHAIVRRVGDREANIGNTHRLERRVCIPALLPRCDKVLAQRTKPFGGDRRQQRALVDEVSVERCT